ncbi:hypothetical protein BCR44DRAFT_250978 [Catenaria anguillulae PL171]|uniref:Uncharacterized protein n=1 Tax=Catenaria anguillulae PL171 TaxID=765915 RepID=A0A1Y2I506_9FUNG|nr:hypothetical protein BCR44DRAFT_250978 [Catenaria anguillulae PL171]
MNHLFRWRRPSCCVVVISTGHRTADEGKRPAKVPSSVDLPAKARAVRLQTRLQTCDGDVAADPCRRHPTRSIAMYSTASSDSCEWPEPRRGTPYTTTLLTVRS